MQTFKSDKTNSENLIKILKRCKIELEGAEEILGTAEVIKWMAGLNNRIIKDLKDQEELEAAKAAVVSAKPVEALETKPEKKAKAKKVE